MSVLPEIFNLAEPTQFERFVEKSDIIEINPSDGQNNIRDFGGQLRFYFTCDRYCLLSSPRSGFRCRVGFLTRGDGTAVNINNNNMNANITLANNWFGHLFKSARLSISGKPIEHVLELGTSMDILYHLKGDDFKNQSGSLCGFIPDENSGLADQIEYTSSVTAAQAAGQAAFNPAMTKNVNFNNGYKRRMEQYNYTVANNDTVRYAECFISLSHIFGFCNDIEKLIKFVNVEIEMIRAQNNNLISFGAANYSMAFGDPVTTGLLKLKLEIETIRPSPEIMVMMNEQIKTPIRCNFLERICENRPATTNQTVQFNANKFNAPRFIFIVSHTPDRNLFTHCNIEKISVSVGDEIYPNLDQGTNFLENTYTKFYQSYLDSAEYFNGKPSLSMKEFKDLYSIFCIDTSNQTEKILGQNRSTGFVIHRRELPADNALRQNQQNVQYYILTLNQCSFEIDCIQNIVKQIN